MAERTVTTATSKRGLAVGMARKGGAGSYSMPTELDRLGPVSPPSSEYDARTKSMPGGGACSDHVAVFHSAAQLLVHWRRPERQVGSPNARRPAGGSPGSKARCNRRRWWRGLFTTHELDGLYDRQWRRSHPGCRRAHDQVERRAISELSGGTGGRNAAATAQTSLHVAGAVTGRMAGDLQAALDDLARDLKGKPSGHRYTDIAGGARFPRAEGNWDDRRSAKRPFNPEVSVRRYDLVAHFGDWRSDAGRRACAALLPADCAVSSGRGASGPSGCDTVEAAML